MVGSSVIQCALTGCTGCISSQGHEPRLQQQNVVGERGGPGRDLGQHADQPRVPEKPVVRARQWRLPFSRLACASSTLTASARNTNVASQVWLTLTPICRAWAARFA